MTAKKAPPKRKTRGKAKPKVSIPTPPFSTRSATAKNPKPNQANRDGFNKLYEQAAADRRAKERRENMVEPTPRNALHAQIAVSQFATQLALRSKPESFEAQGQIHWLHYFADQLGLWATTGEPYSPSLEVARRVGAIIYMHGRHGIDRNEKCESAQEASRALYGLIDDDFDERIESSRSTWAQISSQTDTFTCPGK